MAIDTLFAASPHVINATYDKVWVSEIVISAPDLGGDAQARVLLRKFRSTESGAEFSPSRASGSRSIQLSPGPSRPRPRGGGWLAHGVCCEEGH
jgi:hypothetical protein